MHDDRTTNQFNLFAVYSHGDAAAMLRTVVQTARAFYSFRIAAPFGRASFIDLTCQVCELAGVLGSVKFHRSALAQAGTTRGTLPATAVQPVSDVDWFLGRLPGTVAGLKRMSKSLKLRIAKLQGRGNGLDLQCAELVAKTWLRSAPPRLRSSLLEMSARAGEGHSPSRLRLVRSAAVISMRA